MDSRRSEPTPARLVRAVVARFRDAGFVARRWWTRCSQPAVALGDGVRVHRGVLFAATDGGEIVIGPGCTLSRGATLVAKGGRLQLGAGSFVGPWTTIVARSAVQIGTDALIGERVSIRDQDHEIHGGTGEEEAGFRVAPIVVGDRCWIGAGAVVLRGVRIGDRAVVGANAVVTRDVDAGAIVGGIPAAPIGRRGDASTDHAAR